MPNPIPFPSATAQFAAVYALLTGSHELADYWVQSNADSVIKGNPGRQGQAACLRHVATYTATQAAALYTGHRVLGLRLTPTRAAAVLAVSAITHYVADRSAGHWRDPEPTTLLPRLAERLGKTPWTQADPSAGPLLDQSWHKTWITAAALIAAAGRRTNGA